MGESIDVLEEVRKRYRWRGPWVLDTTSLSLNRGTRTAVVGDNGSGKSTLLRVLGGIAPPTSGHCLVPPQVGYVPERVPARLRMSAETYMLHMGRVRGLDDDRIATRADELFSRLGLRPDGSTSYDVLSKGNRQKVMIAQALLEPVDLLLLDEPFSGLDKDANTTLLELLNEAAADGAAVVVTAHREGSLPDIDRTLRLHEGRLDDLGADHPAGAPASQLMRVSLMSTKAPADTSPLRRVTTVFVVEDRRSDLCVSITVEKDQLDTLLRAALSAGWSVLSVGPNSERNSREPS